VTGCTEYTCEFDGKDYNKGRLAILLYNGRVNFISFSDNNASGRNSSFQSFPTAIVRYYQEKNKDKKIFFYFLPTSGNYTTPYFNFMYRLMKTAGVEFLNEKEFLKNSIFPFSAVEDIIVNRNMNKIKNKSNNSTYLTRNSDNIIQIYGKTYGANKKESTLLCIAISRIADTSVELYQICEQNLSILPKPDLEVIERLGNIKIITTNLTLERKEFEHNDSIRSIIYIYNLLSKLGDKSCAFCDCGNPRLIHGAHIWSVEDIKKESNLNQKEKLKHAIDGDNGIWLCPNHHKMFDLNLLMISIEGKLKIKSDLKEDLKKYIAQITTRNQLSKEILTQKFIEYLEKRNSSIQESQYHLLKKIL
jgi:hypothetical protein